MKDLKTYFRRTIFIHGGMVVSQILILCLGDCGILSSVIAIVIMEPFVMAGYLILFGIKRKDGTLIRNKKIGILMDELTR